MRLFLGTTFIARLATATRFFGLNFILIVYKYKHIITENIKYPGSDKKPKACPKVISWQVDIICKSFINGQRARSIETLQLKVKNIYIQTTNEK